MKHKGHIQVNKVNSVDLYYADTGAANAYVIAPVPAFTSYTDGMSFWFKVANTNTGSSTINVNNLGLKNIKKNVTDELDSGDLLEGAVIQMIYDGTYFQVSSAIGGSTSGLSGYSGYSGIQGTSGYSGYSGIGISGYSGYSGAQGPIGPGGGESGYSGYSGLGLSGYSGYSGSQGPIGPGGGESGYSGFSGTGGSVGTSGYSGYSGTGLTTNEYNRLFTRQSLSNPTGTITFNVNSGAQADITQTSAGGRTLAFSNLVTGDVVKLLFNNTSGGAITLTLPSNSYVAGTGSAASVSIPTGRSLLTLSDYDGTNYLFILQSY